jgi:hypothetical protein
MVGKSPVGLPAAPEPPNPNWTRWLNCWAHIRSVGPEPPGHEPSGHEPSGHEPSGHEPADDEPEPCPPDEPGFPLPEEPGVGCPLTGGDVPGCPPLGGVVGGVESGGGVRVGVGVGATTWTVALLVAEAVPIRPRMAQVTVAVSVTLSPPGAECGTTAWA